MYINNRRFLPPTHPLRKAKKAFPSGKAEHRPPPERLTQEEVMVNSLAYEKARNPTQAAGFATATGSKGCYCLMLLPDHDRTEQVYPDTMHLIKNVTCEMVQLLTGYKDSQKVRKAERELGRFKSTWVQENQEKSSEESSKRGMNTALSGVRLVKWMWTSIPSNLLFVLISGPTKLKASLHLLIHY